MSLFLRVVFRGMRSAKIAFGGVLLAVGFGCGLERLGGESKSPSKGAADVCSHQTENANHDVARDEKESIENESVSEIKRTLEAAPRHLASIEDELAKADLTGKCEAPLKITRDRIAKLEKALEVATKRSDFVKAHEGEGKSVFLTLNSAADGQRAMLGDENYERAKGVLKDLAIVAKDCAMQNILPEEKPKIGQADARLWCWVASHHEALTTWNEKRNDRMTKALLDKRNLVYAMVASGQYYKGTVVERDDKRAYVIFDASHWEGWIDNANVKPREGHGLKGELISDYHAEVEAGNHKRAGEDAQSLQKSRAQCPGYNDVGSCMAGPSCRWVDQACRPHR